MAIAGKVAITPKGEWNAQTAYTKLDLVFYDNASYVAIQPSTGVTPKNTAYWMLVVQSAGGADLEAIIDGTQQVGNAKTLDGHEAEYFAPKEDLAKYLPLTGGTVSGAKSTLLTLENTSSVGCYQEFRGSNGKNGSLGFMGVDTPVMLTASGAVKDLLHTGNMTTGTYTGNGDATQRIILTGSIRNVFVVRQPNTTNFAIVTESGYIGKLADTVVCGVDVYADVNLVIKSVSQLFNTSGVVYKYYSL